VCEKHESQVGELDMLQLEAVVLHDSIGKEVHMTQPIGFIVIDLIYVD